MSGVIEVGFGEKCPYCDLIVNENIDFYDHITSQHQDELLANLFPKRSKENGKNK
tara:strand:- start:407 stop:571 length:165 start_codon:yes stop_codon:yes gene_type:complete